MKGDFMKTYFERFEEGDNITVTPDFLDEAKSAGMWYEIGNALLNYMVELRGINDTIEWLAAIGFSEENLREMGFDYNE